MLYGAASPCHTVLKLPNYQTNKLILGSVARGKKRCDLLVQMFTPKREHCAQAALQSRVVFDRGWAIKLKNLTGKRYYAVLKKPRRTHTTLYRFGDKFFIHILHLKSPSLRDHKPWRFMLQQHSVLLWTSLGLAVVLMNRQTVYHMR